jgi:hypothetical protein
MKSIRILLLGLIMMGFTVQALAQSQYPLVKIHLESGMVLNGKNASLTGTTVVASVSGMSQTYKMEDIKMVQAKKGLGAKYGSVCGGSCFGLSLGTFLAAGGEGVDAGSYFLGAALWAGIFYGGGWLIGTAMDSWETVYIR